MWRSSVDEQTLVLLTFPFAPKATYQNLTQELQNTVAENTCHGKHSVTSEVTVAHLEEGHVRFDGNSCSCSKGKGTGLHVNLNSLPPNFTVVTVLAGSRLFCFSISSWSFIQRGRFS